MDVTIITNDNKETKKKIRLKKKPSIESFVGEEIDKYIPILIDRYIENLIVVSQINKFLLENKKIRHDNFPSYISENIVKFALNKIYYSNSQHKVKWNTSSGDLEFNGSKYEVKAFMSYGPSSFWAKGKVDENFFCRCY